MTLSTEAVEPRIASLPEEPEESGAPRLRVLWLLDSLTVGGAESLVLTLAQAVPDSRLELVVACLTTIDGNLLEHEIRARGISTYNLHAKGLRDAAAFARLQEIVKEERIDLVHAHLTYASMWAAMLTRRTGIPSVASIHVAPSATLSLRSGVRHRLSTRAREVLMRIALSRWCTRVVAVSAAVRAHYEKVIDRRRLLVVHNGIDVDRFAKNKVVLRATLDREFDLPPGAVLAGSVAVLRPGKGIDVLLRALQDVPQLHLLVVGDGPKRAEWTQLATDLAVADRVRWAGFRRDLDEILPGCDLFIHPSLDDAFPTVLLEAMAASLPVVASRVGGIPEIVEDGSTGTLVPPGDPRALGQALGSLLNDPMRLERFGTRGRAAVEERFSTEAWIERLAAVYAAAIGDRR